MKGRDNGTAFSLQRYSLNDRLHIRQLPFTTSRRYHLKNDGLTIAVNFLQPGVFGGGAQKAVVILSHCECSGRRIVWQ